MNGKIFFWATDVLDALFMKVKFDILVLNRHNNSEPVQSIFQEKTSEFFVKTRGPSCVATAFSQSLKKKKKRYFLQISKNV
jgi:hypothetical protein